MPSPETPSRSAGRGAPGAGHARNRRDPGSGLPGGRSRPDLPRAPVEGPGVSVHPVTHYLGLAGFARARRRVRHDLLTAMASPETAWLLRLPGLLTRLAAGELGSRRTRYAVEAIGDPADVLRSGSLPGAGPLIAGAAGRSMARFCRRALAAAYVTESLRRRYPPAGTLQAVYSDVDLTGEA